MALHYVFDEPLDVSNMLRDLAKSIESRPVNFAYGARDPAELEFDVAVGALREAADKIEAAVDSGPKKT